MKILNQTYRDVQQEVLNKTPVSELQFTSELIDESLLHIVQYSSEHNAYESMKITLGDFKQKIYESVQDTFKTKYWDTHNGASDTDHENASEYEDIKGNAVAGASFQEMVEYLRTSEKDFRPDAVDNSEPDAFIKHVYYDFDVIKRYIVLKNNRFEFDLDSIRARLDELECYFYTRMRFHTTDQNGAYSNISVNHLKSENDIYCQMKIEYGNKISNTWQCPASGNLVVYGWLDSTQVLNNKAIQRAYCVIEGLINPSDSADNWEIISVQPVIPAKTITYVGFNLLVHEGLVIRARTGFTVGNGSGNFANEQDGNDTLSNSVPNGFKCMIYSSENYKSETQKTWEREGID